MAQQLAGPAFMILISGAMLFLAIHRKEIRWWIGLLGLIGAIHTGLTSAVVSHDFSHTVFHQCSNVYGNSISWASTAIGLAFLLISMLNRSSPPLTDY